MIQTALPYARADFRPPQPIGYPLPRVAPPPPEQQAGRLDVPIDQLSFRQLRTPAQIARVLPLRQAIALPETVLSDPGFDAREKKETRRGWLARSSAMAPSSGPSA